MVYIYIYVSSHASNIIIYKVDGKHNQISLFFSFLIIFLLSVFVKGLHCPCHGRPCTIIFLHHKKARYDDDDDDDDNVTA